MDGKKCLRGYILIAFIFLIFNIATVAMVVTLCAAVAVVVVAAKKKEA